MEVKTLLKKKVNPDLIFALLLVIFIIFTLLLASRLRMGLSPDSYYHLRVSEAYSTTLGVPPNTPDTYQWRDITRIPYLYFWINGRVLNATENLIDGILILRIVNIIYSSLTVLIAYLLSKELIKGTWKRILPTFLLMNTLMFTFLSSSINYDNLANLFSVFGIYLFVRFFKSKLDFKFLFLMLISLGLGSFTKFTVFPLALILVLLAVYHIYKNRKEIKLSDIIKYWYLFIPLLLVLFFNIQVYSVNYFRYGSLRVPCEKILTHEQCLENGVYYRNRTETPLQEIEGVENILRLIFTGERIDFVRYFGLWVWDITGKIFGIMGDSSLYMPEYFKYFFITLLFIAIVSGVINRKQWEKIDIYVLIVTLFYVGVLFFLQNYKTYIRSNRYYLALQGRYVFPVIVSLYILFSKSIFSIKIKWIKIAVLLLLIGVFSYSCIPFFLLNVPDSWF